MADYTHNFYDKKINSYGDNFTGYTLPASSFGFPSDPRTANQIDAVSKKLNTGAKVIEVSAVNIAKGEGPMGLIDYIPKQHFKEIERLKKLSGAELTFHAPLVEATGWSEGGWNEAQRKQVEREVLSSIQRGHDLDPNGNIVITFHTSNGLPEPHTKVKDENGKEISSRFLVINEQTGKLSAIPGQQENYFENKITNPKAQIEDFNIRQWTDSLSQVTRLADQARISFIRGTSFRDEEGLKRNPEFAEKIPEFFKLSENNPEGYEKFLNNFKTDTERYLAKQTVNELGFAKQYAKDAYLSLQEIYNNAYDSATKQNNKQLQKALIEVRERVVPKLQEHEKNPEKLKEFIDEIARTTRNLNSIRDKEGKPVVPVQYRPLEEFGIEKASETFANAAFDAYKEFGPSTPILGLENPPAGMGISRAEDIKKLVEAAHKKFSDKAVEDGMSRKEADKKAKEIIGVTWDVGHINMIRKSGYDDKDIVKETKTIAPYIKHVHLSDNFGLAHTELPMGMGNVPIKEHEEVLRKQFGDKVNKIKQIVETGGWFADFKTTPFRETLSAFNSSLYPMQMSSYWKTPPMHGYFSGYGTTLPDVHFQTYGAGFSGLPTALGGEMQGRSRVSGSPME